MSNSMVLKDIVVEAFAEGAKKLGTKVCVQTHQDGVERRMPGAGACVGPHPQLKPGEAYSDRGGTVFKPQRSDPEVEAILGKHVYNPKIDPKSKEEMLLNANKQQQEISELKATVQALVAGLVQNAGQNQATQIAKPIENNVEPVTKPVTETVELSPDLPMDALRAIAKPYGIKTARMSKEKLIEAINYARG